MLACERPRKIYPRKISLTNWQSGTKNFMTDLDLRTNISFILHFYCDVFSYMEAFKKYKPSKYSSFAFVFRSRLEDVFIKTNIFTLLIHLQKTSWSRAIYSPWKYVFKTSSKCLQDVLKTFWRRLQGVLKTFSKRLQDIFKISSKTTSGHLQDVFETFWRRLRDVCKMYHQVKLFLLTCFQDVFEIYSKRFWDILQRRLSIEGFA